MLFPSVVIVIPCFNEASRLRPEVFLDFLASHDWASLLFVDDGSRDQTRQSLEALKDRARGRIDLLFCDQNGGKAEAIRRGILHAKSGQKSFAWFGYLDADLATPLTEVGGALQYCGDRLPQTDLILGSRIKRLGALVRRRAARHYLGRIFATVASLVLGLPVYDTQCGLKLFPARNIDYVFAKPFLSRWLFDVEILARMKSRGAIFLEYPLQVWTEVGQSRLGLSSFLKAPWELYKISRTYR